MGGKGKRLNGFCLWSFSRWWAAWQVASPFAGLDNHYGKRHAFERKRERREREKHAVFYEPRLSHFKVCTALYLASGHVAHGDRHLWGPQSDAAVRRHGRVTVDKKGRERDKEKKSGCVSSWDTGWRERGEPTKAWRLFSGGASVDCSSPEIKGAG